MVASGSWQNWVRTRGLVVPVSWGSRLKEHWRRCTTQHRSVLLLPRGALWPRDAMRSMPSPECGVCAVPECAPRRSWHAVRPSAGLGSAASAAGGATDSAFAPASAGTVGAESGRVMIDALQTYCQRASCDNVLAFDALEAARQAGTQPGAQTHALAHTAFSTPGLLLDLLRVVQAAASAGDAEAPSWFQKHLSESVRRSLPAATVASLLSQGKAAARQCSGRSAALAHGGQVLVTADAKPGIGLSEEALARLVRLQVQDGRSEALPAVWMALASSCPSTAVAATTAAAPAAAPAWPIACFA